MRHKKVYTENGVKLTCVGKAILSSPERMSNFEVDKCCWCGMYVSTTGSNPETDKVEEIYR
ncbi:hypothetical protein LCGC14_0345820 [marine sediment metagenome]|uniref:Uncharacterized protein n=1 Tax=marine sediment metagenome TaxID=412755 RepID=A0A0F9TC41_9ZZZZ